MLTLTSLESFQRYLSLVPATATLRLDGCEVKWQNDTFISTSHPDIVCCPEKDNIDTGRLTVDGLPVIKWVAQNASKEEVLTAFPEFAQPQETPRPRGSRG